MALPVLELVADEADLEAFPEERKHYFPSWLTDEEERSLGQGERAKTTLLAVKFLINRASPSELAGKKFDGFTFNQGLAFQIGQRILKERENG